VPTGGHPQIPHLKGGHGRAVLPLIVGHIGLVDQLAGVPPTEPGDKLPLLAMEEEHNGIALRPGPNKIGVIQRTNIPAAQNITEYPLIAVVWFS